MTKRIAQKVARRVLRADEGERDIPKTVKRYVKEHKEQGADESKAWALAWSRYCVTADTVVQTSKGMCTIAELYDTSQNEEVLHSDGVKARKVQINVATHRGYSGASHIIATGEKPVVEVETKHHYRLTCTPDHKILVLNEDDYSIEWVSSEDAQGRYAVLPSKGLWGSKTDLPKFSYIKNVWNNLVPVKQPKEMTLDLARVLGYLVAEGDITEEGVGFSNTNERIIQDYSRAIENLFGECPDVEWRNRAEKGWKDCGKVRLRTRWYSEFFSSLGLTPGTAHNKVVPKVILKAPKKFVVEFLRGFVEGDGYTGDEDHLNRVGFATASDTLANQLHIILLNLGLPATFETNKRGYHNIRIHGFDLVQKYKGVVGSVFKPISMPEERRKHRGSEFTMLPAKALLNSNSRFRTAFPGSNRVGSFRIRRNWDVFEKVRKDEPDLIENMQKLLDRGYYFDKIISVQGAGTQEVYDLSVPEHSSFVANGLLAHNCKYKYPNSPHCKKDPDEYFKGRGSNLKRVASRVVDKTVAKYVDINGVKFNKDTLRRMSDESMEKADQLAAEGRHIEIKFKYVDNDPNKNNRIVIVDSGGEDYEVIPIPLEALDFVNYLETWTAEDAEQARRETEQPSFHVATEQEKEEQISEKDRDREQRAETLLEEYAEELADAEREITFRFEYNEHGKPQVVVKDSHGPDDGILSATDDFAILARTVDYWFANPGGAADTDIERHITEMEGKEYKEASRIANEVSVEFNDLRSQTRHEIVSWLQQVGDAVEDITLTKATITSEISKEGWLRTKTKWEGDPHPEVVDEICETAPIRRPVIVDYNHDTLVEGRHRMAAGLQCGIDVPVVIIDRHVAGRIASRVIKAYPVSLPSSLHDSIREYTSKLSQRALRPFPTEDPVQYKYWLVGHLKQEMSAFMPEGIRLEEADLEQLLSDLIREGQIHLTQDLMEKAYDNVMGRSLPDVGSRLLGQLQSQLNDMTEEVAKDVSNLPSLKNAVRLITKIGVSEYEAQQMLDFMVERLEIEIPLDDQAIDSLVNFLIRG